MTSSSETGAPYVREATTADLNNIVEMETRAFLTDPLFNYVGDVRIPLVDPTQARGRESLRRMMYFITKSAFLLGARAMVCATRGGGPGMEQILACCLWCPPKRRIELHRVHHAISAGFFPIFGRWGLKGLSRLSFEYLDKCEKVMEENFKQRKNGQKPKHSWYLLLASTDPDHQGKGLLGRLIREQFEHAPSATYTLESTTPRSRDVYAHYGWEVMQEFRCGVGKVDEKGMPPAESVSPAGVPFYSMVKWGSEK